MTAPIGRFPRAQLLADGKRLHCQQGPIDLIMEADGPRETVLEAYRNTALAFDGVLTGLVDELVLLRSPWNEDATPPRGKIALRMWDAVTALGHTGFLTPMIAVAGAVADEMLNVLTAHSGLTRAYVNNGGDIALWLADGEHFDIGICADPVTGVLAAKATLAASDGIGGIATSGWRGRSHSLGIADAVTVLAKDAATADTAATLIANAVDLPGSAKVQRQPANELSPDNDLVDRLVTTGVGKLSSAEIDTALAPGIKHAEQMIAQGHIVSAALALQGRFHPVNLDDNAYRQLDAREPVGA